MQIPALFLHTEDRTQPIEKRHTYDSPGSRSLAGNHRCGWNEPTGSRCAHPTPWRSPNSRWTVFPPGMSRAPCFRASTRLPHASTLPARPAKRKQSGIPGATLGLPPIRGARRWLMTSSRRAFLSSAAGAAGASVLTAQPRGGAGLPQGRISPMDGRYNGPAEMKEYAEAVVKPAILGKNPFDVEYPAAGLCGPRARGLWAGVDTAMWDII